MIGPFLVYGINLADIGGRSENNSGCDIKNPVIGIIEPRKDNFYQSTDI